MLRHHVVLVCDAFCEDDVRLNNHPILAVRVLPELIHLGLYLVRILLVLALDVFIDGV